MIQQYAHPLPALTLHGVENPPPRIKLTKRSWFDGTFAQKTEARYSASMGLRAYFVRTDNELNLSLFGKLRDKAGTHVVIGKNGVLYEQSYLDNVRRPRQAHEETIVRTIERLKRFHALCREKGVGFLLVVSPSKVTVCPESVPEGALPPPEKRKAVLYDRMMPRIREAGIPVLDGRELFLKWKPDAAAPLFPKGGTHWSYYGAARILETMIPMLEKQTGKNFPNPRVTGVKTDRKIYREDADLMALLNIWTLYWRAGIQHHPVIEKDTDPAATPGDFLCIGDSFSHALNHLMDQQGVTGSLDNFYYFHRRIHYPGETQTPFERETIDPKTEIESRDAIIIEINEYWFPDFGFDFISQALRAYGLDL